MQRIYFNLGFLFYRLSDVSALISFLKTGPIKTDNATYSFIRKKHY